MNANSIPVNLTCGGVPTAEGRTAQAFGHYFYTKIKSNIEKTCINKDTIYNGKNKMIVQNRNFMTRKDVEMCMLDILAELINVERMAYS